MRGFLRRNEDVTKIKDNMRRDRNQSDKLKSRPCEREVAWPPRTFVSRILPCAKQKTIESSQYFRREVQMGLCSVRKICHNEECYEYNDWIGYCFFLAIECCIHGWEDVWPTKSMWEICHMI